MNIEEFRDYCLQKKGVTEELPFDETTLVYKVSGKMFALTDTDDEFKIALKCDPEKVIDLREQFPETVLPGYHFNKKYWNTVVIDGTIPEKLLYEWIDESYVLVVSKLPKTKQQELEID
ncbi:MAG: MmcQ/YjbR family DNA-binding protein [Bacteroidales bacterium]|nr:MmcQ/YjbR family DNA-binding protein [Bacteroidales bacterium]